ncbi:ATP-binding protein [Oceanomicrobium pacificus]|uniref:histidine kinase n=1 Tax=Oceanomicrobium pacificus TaxID=2692916 RepID=A0A6B0TVC6_9RHOB|nr:ATP-binding protein [Oceanomicrobium pacificus]MXU65725.1 HAMP domain-containing protein [Oceanomicrobium pacificus]
MNFSWLKSYMPRSLFGRALLIMVVPIVALQLVVATAFIQRHFAQVTAQMTRPLASEINYLVQEIEQAPDLAAARAALVQLAGPFELALTIEENDRIPPKDQVRFYDLSGRSVITTLRERVNAPIQVDLASDAGNVDMRVMTEKGVLRVLVERDRVSASNPHQLLVLMILTSILLTIIAVLFLRNQVRPIRRLAEAAEAFGKGRSLEFRPRGAEEVRRAGNAFLSMRSRLERQIEQRTLMLSGVSHDLRTPLTRLKLSLSLLPDEPEAAEMLRDVDDMERMLAEFLAFARGDSLEATEPVDAISLAEGLVEDARRHGATVSLALRCDTPEDRQVAMRRSAMERAVQNLLNNAHRFGTRVGLSVTLLEKTLEYTVEDNGPGIPADRREEAMRPFARLDEARSVERGGNVGLGLSIAADAARSHGGVLELGDSADLGGLRATIRIPR